MTVTSDFFPSSVLILFFFFEGVVSSVKYLKLQFHFVVVVAAFWESLQGTWYVHVTQSFA